MMEKQANIEEKMKKMLSPKRFCHCKRVAETACEIAKTIGYDSKKAYMAGLLHDIAKEMDKAQLFELCKEGNFDLSEKEKQEYWNLHGPAGAIYAKNEFGINDEDLLFAIANHSGRPAMKDIEKIVLIADIDDFLKRKSKNANFVEKIKDKESLNDTLFNCLKVSINYCIEAGEYFPQRTQDAYDYLLASRVSRRLEKSKTDIPADFKEDWVSIANEIIKTHGIKLQGADNVRDLGGYKTLDGKKIKKHMLLRSSSLHNLTVEDAKIIKNYGIKTIIDLRTQKEVSSSPDSNIESFENFNFPLPLVSPETEEYRSEILHRYERTKNESEKAFYLAQYFGYINMSSMYENILFDADSKNNIKKIFKLISEKNGVLFHCVSGKDRTGIIAFLILSVLGVDLETIISDFYTSRLYQTDENNNLIEFLYKNGYSKEITNEAIRYTSVGYNSLRNTHKLICERCQSLENYIKKELGISQLQIDKLKNKYLEV